ncbi:MAG: TrmH family RNA methyltransferase [Pseudonocardiaceae bacterium]
MARKIDQETTAHSPRDQFITIYGRMPVLEALQKQKLEIAKVMIADNAHGSAIDQIVDAAHQQDIEVRYTSPTRIKRLAGNGKQDQGVVADIAAPRMARLSDYLAKRDERRTTLFLLDGVTNPSNVGMILRSATAAGIDGVILPRLGSPHVGPLVIKASAGVAFEASILNSASAAAAAAALHERGFTLYGLTATAKRSIFQTDLAPRAVLVLGGETHGSTIPTDVQLRIPMRNHVESLNVAVAASIVAFEISRRRG